MGVPIVRILELSGERPPVGRHIVIPDWLEATDGPNGIELRPRWRPVTDPPALGEEVCLCDERTEETLVGFRASDGVYGVFADGADGFAPTHWLPLIPLPRSDAR